MHSTILGSSTISGQAAGVPYLALPPTSRRAADAPVVLAWHMLDAPRTEAAFAAALPLRGLDAWRVYLGLPMTGSRLPAGGPDALLHLAVEDVVLKLYGPLVELAAAEFAPAFAELRRQLGLGDQRIGVMGGSIGAAIAQLLMATGDLQARAAVLVSPVVQLRRTVEAGERQFGFSYQWSPEASAAADRFDFVARASELGETAVLLVVGEQDDPAFRASAAALHAALGSERSSLLIVPDMAHALAEEPGLEPAPQTPHAALIDRRAVEWFRRHLGDAPRQP